jgi:hypothetical protein
VDDERIRQLTAEVMSVLRAPEASPGASSSGASLEDRVAALERAVRGTAPVSVQVVTAGIHSSQSLLGPSAPPGGRCVMEPDKPCVQSGMCRALGH